MKHWQYNLPDLQVHHTCRCLKPVLRNGEIIANSQFRLKYSVSIRNSEPQPVLHPAQLASLAVSQVNQKSSEMITFLMLSTPAGQCCQSLCPCEEYLNPTISTYRQCVSPSLSSLTKRKFFPLTLLTRGDKIIEYLLS